MVHSDVHTQVVKNGVEYPNQFALTAPHKGAGSDSSDEKKEGQIRVGRDYQAVPPPFIPPSERREEHSVERALLVWAPRSDGIEDTKLDEFISGAKEKYGYNTEQALGMVFWHKHDLDRALQDLANFTPFSEQWKWNLEDKVLFEQAFQFHGKSFQRIRQMLPDKSVADLVKYYYSWKKTRTRTSLMDRHARRVMEVREEGLYGEENYPEAGSESDEKMTEEPGPKQKDQDKMSPNTKSSPPKGLKIKHDDLTAFATGQGVEIMQGLDGDIVSCKRLVQNNKQLISALHRKAREVDVTNYRVEQQEDVINVRWTEKELLLGVQGVRMWGKDFSSISSILGTKTVAHVETFFNSYKHKFNLDSVLQEWQNEMAEEKSI